MHRLWGAAAAQAGRLLRLLFIWFGAVPADAGTARRRRRGSQPLFGGKGIMTDGSVRASRDWLDSTPVGIVAALLLTVGVRNAIWTAALSGWAWLASSTRSAVGARIAVIPDPIFSARLYPW